MSKVYVYRQYREKEFWKDEKIRVFTNRAAAQAFLKENVEADTGMSMEDLVIMQLKNSYFHIQKDYCFIETAQDCYYYAVNECETEDRADLLSERNKEQESKVSKENEADPERDKYGYLKDEVLPDALIRERIEQELLIRYNIPYEDLCLRYKTFSITHPPAAKDSQVHIIRFMYKPENIEINFFHGKHSAFCSVPLTREHLDTIISHCQDEMDLELLLRNIFSRLPGEEDEDYDDEEYEDDHDYEDDDDEEVVE